jgi:hypothetical protein
MTSGQPTEPEPEQNPDADGEDQSADQPQRGLTIGELTGRTYSSGEETGLRGIPGSVGAALAAQEALRKAGLADSPAQRLARVLGANRQALGLPSEVGRLVGGGAAKAVADMLRRQNSVGEPWSRQQAAFLSRVDLRPLLPGAALFRSEAFRLAAFTGWDSLNERLQQFEPENWRGEGLDHVEMLTVMEEGIPLVWTPGPEVIRALVAEEDPAARRKVLEQHAAAVTSHCRAVLDDIERDDLARQVEHLNNCLDLLASGPTAPAQALAANVWDTTLRAIVRADPSLQANKGYFTYPAVTSKLPKATMETTLGRFRAYCINTCVHVACTTYFGPPVPEHYSRHATSHATGLTQYTLANALTAVMLVVGLLRELEETGRPITAAD